MSMAIAPGEKAETRKLAQEVGARSVTQLEAGLGRIMGETGANLRWLLGALVLLNGGGAAIAAALHSALEAKILESTVSFLVVGAALAVLAALVNAIGALLLSRQIGEAIALWAQVGASGEISDQAIKSAGRVRFSGLALALVTLGLALIALILFVAGAMTLDSGLASPEPVIAPVASLPVPTVVTPLPLPQRTPIATPQSAPLEPPKALPAETLPAETKPAPAPAKPEPKPEPRKRAPRPENGPASTTPSPAPAAPAPTLPSVNP